MSKQDVHDSGLRDLTHSRDSSEFLGIAWRGRFERVFDRPYGNLAATLAACSAAAAVACYCARADIAPAIERGLDMFFG